MALVPSADAVRILPTSRWELAIEAIAVKIRWFGLVVGYLLVNLGDGPHYQQAFLNAILTLGAAYTLLDTWHSAHGRVLLGRHPLLIALMEAIFIGLLCYYHRGVESPFRFYYLLSLICCAIRHASSTTWICCGMHCLSLLLIFIALPAAQRRALPFVLTLVILVWVTWASNALSFLLKQVGDHLERLNSTLREHQAQLEDRIAERSRELQEAQAHVLHQDKMAALGLLAAGVVHEVGNPLTSISSMLQILQRREHDEHTADKLALMNGQLKRIQTTLRELGQFSRPPSAQRGRVFCPVIIEEALKIARFYKRTSGLELSTNIEANLPPVYGARDQLIQVVLNLILNAIDATATARQTKTERKIRGRARIKVEAKANGNQVMVSVIDNGCGLTGEQEGQLFQPYFTTKAHGTGLGLFVTQKLVQEHGGVIEYQPNPKGGAIFRFTLPAIRNENREEEVERVEGTCFDCR